MMSRNRVKLIKFTEVVRNGEKYCCVLKYPNKTVFKFADGRQRTFFRRNK